MLNKQARQFLFSLLRLQVNITQRQAVLAILGFALVGSLFLLLGLLVNDSNDTSGRLSSGIGIVLFGGLLVAYWQGWDYARYVMVVIISLLAALTTLEPFSTSYVSFILIIPPILALVLAGPIWVIGSAVLTLGMLMVRTGGQGIYANPQTLILYGMIVGVLVMSRLIVATARRAAVSQAQQAEEALVYAKQRRQFLRTIIDHIPIMLAFIDAKEQLALVNREWEQVLSWPMETIKDYQDLLMKLYPDPEHRQTMLDLAMTTEPEWHELATTTEDGRLIDILWTHVRLSDDSRIVIGRDITARKQLQEQLYQAQKMDAIGQLAGGIAHDFNNLLVPIIGYAELTMLNLPEESELYSNLTRVLRAAEQAASLTGQILAFSRKQMLEVRSLQLDDIIVELEPLLRRLIGEDIDLQTVLTPTLWLVKADKSQLEQVLLNLVVNARDAMPDGGGLTIETDNVFLDEKYAETHLEVRPGPYVLLAVSDTGHGMDVDTEAHIFEPFFTTKEQGKGTGLGLATVYGIVKQHSGSIWVYSEPGQGTTFKVYLPQTADAPQEVEASTEIASAYGTETVLIVEDAEMTRKLIRDTLEVYGYNVLEVQTPTESLQLISTFNDTIHLLLTDIIMPEMNGRELYDRVARSRPDIKVLYVSGYTGNVIARRGILQKGVNFLQKPFTIHSLTQKVREVLG